MSFREVYDKVQDIVLDVQSEWEATEQWILEYGEYAKEFICNGSTRLPPKTPRPKKRKHEGSEGIQHSFDGKKGLQACPLSSNKKSVPGCQNFSLKDTMKDEARASENHTIQLSLPNENLSQDSGSNSKKSSGKKCSSISNGIMAGDKLILAKIAKMSETQRRSSLTRYHRNVAINQVVKRLSLEKRRSSFRLNNPRQGASDDHPIETIQEHLTPIKKSAIDTPTSSSETKRCKSSGVHPVVILEKLDMKTLSVAKNASSPIRVVPTDASPAARQNMERRSPSLCPKIVIAKLSEEVIIKHSSDYALRAVLATPQDDGSGSDSYISADDEDDDVIAHVSSTPVAASFIKKAANQKPAYPGSEPRPSHHSRVAYLASLLKNSNRPSGSIGNSSLTSRTATSFVKASRPPSFVLAQKKVARLQEELRLKKEKEDMALKRREQMLKERVLSQKK